MKTSNLDRMIADGIVKAWTQPRTGATRYYFNGVLADTLEALKADDYKELHGYGLNGKADRSRFDCAKVWADTDGNITIEIAQQGRAADVMGAVVARIIASYEAQEASETDGSEDEPSAAAATETATEEKTAGFDKAAIMRRAWQLYKEAGCTCRAEFAAALKEAWAEAKGLVAQNTRVAAHFEAIAQRPARKFEIEIWDDDRRPTRTWAELNRA
ncbi:MAG: hypothetical protein FWG30_12080 [Eubacteriaceae bacterium]|nr:hypothetical protein [Eubacteriaceae bacterium]